MKCLETWKEKLDREREDLIEEFREFHRRMVEGKKFREGRTKKIEKFIGS